jgi:predicted  nucleic acid-binding Zn-ribbon protein
MTGQPETEVESLRQSLSAFKAELAKVIVGMQAGGDRKQRRDLTRRMDACKRKAKQLTRHTESVLSSLDEGHDARSELETAVVFLGKVQDLGNGAG